MKFRTSLAKFGNGKHSGFGSSGDLDPGAVAELIFGETLNGAHLFAYLFRRFGYPNTGWDDRKNLVCYALTTPMPGLFLTVTPYLGNGTTIHFGVLMTKKVDEAMNKPRWDSCQKHRLFLDRWARKHLTYGIPEPGETREILWVRKDKEQKPTGQIITWRKGENHKWIPKRGTQNWYSLLDFVIGDIYRKAHPEPKAKCKKRMARWTAQRDNWKLGPRNFIYRMNAALDATLRDLLTATSVRDINLNAVRCGDDTGEKAYVEPYEHAGCTARYLAGKKLLP